MVGLKVVIADDSRLMRAMIKKVLSNLGADVVGEASDGEEAIELIRKLRPDLAILDINMPKKDGLSVAREIKGDGVNTKVALLTALNQPWVLEEAKKLGVTAFIPKPFKKEKLKEVIDNVRKD